MLLLDGKAAAAQVRADLRVEVETLARHHGRPPRLDVILVGEDPASQVYVRNKIKACEDVGVISHAWRLEAAADAAPLQAELEALIARLNLDPAVDGILLQLPLPRGLDSQKLLDMIDPAKDVDGFHPVNMGRLVLGLPGLRPCTPQGCLDLLARHNLFTAGKSAVVVGRSNIVGKPLTVLLGLPGKMGDATVTMCHSKTPDLAERCRQADFLFVAIGRPKFVTREMVKPGAVVVDVGINRTDAGLCGDVDFEGVKDVAAALTPVPGGVGPMTIARLLANTVQAYTARM